MYVRILGELEVFEGACHLTITAPKPRMLLTALALSPGRVLSTDVLLEELWGDRPPSTGLKTLRYHLSKLRHTLQPPHTPEDKQAISTQPGGYVLTIPPLNVDACRFERDVSAARNLLRSEPILAAARLRKALDLWRGPIPTEVFEAPLSGLEARRLEELRLGALEDRINVDLDIGPHREIVAELETLVRTHPLRERFWAQWMIALYRNDRQAEALGAYQQLRTILDEELGIEPSPDLQRIEESILLQEKDLERQSLMYG